MQDSIFEISKQLNPIKPDRDLWRKIEASLIQESSRGHENVFRLFLKHKALLTAAAVLIVSFSLMALYFYSSPDFSDRILSAQALIKVEYTEKSYMAAIELLSLQAENHAINIDSELTLLYRDKLTTIETQITQCREAIANNPGNAHIRRYMLAALQDKKDTLNEIINLAQRSKS